MLPEGLLSTICPQILLDRWRAVVNGGEPAYARPTRCQGVGADPRVRPAARGRLYGVRKVYHQLRRENVLQGSGVTRCTVEPLMTEHAP